MKRIWAFILVVIVAVSAFTPCCTVDECQDEIATSTKQDHSKADDGSGCSPFVVCSGCFGFTTMERSITVPVPIAFHPLYFETDIHFISSTYFITPWQPPRYV